MRFPEFLKSDGTIGFVAPSFGCNTEPYKTAFKNAQKKLGELGHKLDIGPNCYAGDGIGISSTPQNCGKELTDYYCSENNDALISCGGGELMCETLDYVDFEKIMQAKPKWYMGFSDNTNFTFLLTTICDVASIYAPCAASFGMEPWHESIQDAYDVLTGKKNIEISKAGIARTFQNIRLFKDMPVLDNVKVGLHNHHSYSTLTGILRLPKYHKVEKEMNEKAMEILKVFDLDKEADTLAGNLPYGKQRKLEIARALATDPKLLLLDEPAAGMNPNETQELMDTIRFVQKHFDMTTLLIEHDMKLVGGICEEVTVLNFGQVLAQGETLKVLKDPAVVTAYLGE